MATESGMLLSEAEYSLSGDRHSADASWARSQRHVTSLARTRLPMSAYVTPVSSPQMRAQPKENQQDLPHSSKSLVQSPRAVQLSHPLQSSNQL